MIVLEVKFFLWLKTFLKLKFFLNIKHYNKCSPQSHCVLIIIIGKHLTVSSLKIMLQKFIVWCKVCERNCELQAAYCGVLNVKSRRYPGITSLCNTTKYRSVTSKNVLDTKNHVCALQVNAPLRGVLCSILMC